MSNVLESELRTVFESIVILSPTSFTFFGGKTVEAPPGTSTTIPGHPTHPLPANPLVRALQSELYMNCYTRRMQMMPATAGGADTAGDADAQAVVAPDPAFVAQLSAANHGQTGLDPGWEIYHVGPTGEVFVQKGERQRIARPGAYIVNGANAAPQVGGFAGLQVVAEVQNAQPGYYFAYGTTLGDQSDDFAMTRFYHNIAAEAAPALLEYLSRELNRYQLPYQYKCQLNPQGYMRADPAVLYLADRYYQLGAQLIASFPDSLADQLRSSTPMFTRSLRPGVGLAQEPGLGESFGMHRCRLVAEAVVDVWSQGLQTAEARLEATRNRFAMNGLSLDYPYLNPGSDDIFASSPTGGNAA